MLFDPLTTMTEILPADFVSSTDKRTPNASGNAVIVGGKVNYLGILLTCQLDFGCPVFELKYGCPAFPVPFLHRCCVFPRCLTQLKFECPQFYSCIFNPMN